MARIFISYRRADTGDICDRLAAQLRWRFGVNAVFRDVNTILAGADFTKAIVQGIDESLVVLVLIGASWANIADARGRRLDQPDDYVRREIAQAIQGGKVIVPILTHGAALPPPYLLPADIAALAGYVPLALRPNPWFAGDLAEIERRILPLVRWRPASGIAALLSLYTLIVFGFDLLHVVFSALNGGFWQIVYDPVPLLAASVGASALLWSKAASSGRRWWATVALLIPLPVVAALAIDLSGNLVVINVMLLPVAGLVGIAASLFGPHGRQATDAISIHLPVLNIITLAGSIALGLSVVAASIALYLPGDSGPLATLGSFLLGLLAALVSAACGAARAVIVGRWGWMIGLLLGWALLVAIVFLSLTVSAFNNLGSVLAYIAPLLYCEYLIMWATGQVSRSSRQAAHTVGAQR